MDQWNGAAARLQHVGRQSILLGLVQLESADDSSSQQAARANLGQGAEALVLSLQIQFPRRLL